MQSEQWRSVTPAGMELQPGSSRGNLTGAWRSEFPVIDFDRCTHCMICWIECPDNCFVTEDRRLNSVSLDYCKGCGICASVCPVHCIEMVPEKSE